MEKSKMGRERAMSDFTHIPARYRPLPFWSWNAQLQTSETTEQIDNMNNNGMGGFFMHARGGLETAYLGQEWFENVTTSVQAAAHYGMQAWAYDENGWPSGFGDGIVTSQGVDFQQKWLCKAAPDTVVTNEVFRDVHGVYYFEVNPYYVDVLNRAVTDCFIQQVYEPYYQAYQQQITGFFTDEPQIAREGIPWSTYLTAAYEERFGEPVYPHLYKLFINVDDFQETRVRFYKLVTDLFSQNFMKPLYDWCTQRGLAFTGHLLLEESLESQLLPNGAAMPHYEYFSMPGIDWLTRNITPCLTALQAGSVAQQLGKKQVLAEDFALAGHNVSFEELRGILEWQMVQGVTVLCPHLQGYSLKGIRKRDYPPAMFYQQPWWPDYSSFIEGMSRIGMLLSEGTADCDILLLHPQTSAWACFNAGENEGLQELNQAFLDTIRQLQEKHLLFHLGDETILERHGHVIGQELVIQQQRYRKIVLPKHLLWLDTTKALLQAFVDNGGEIVTTDELLKNPIIDNPHITYTKRTYRGQALHYFVNSTNQVQEAVLACDGVIIQCETGETTPASKHVDLAPYDSLLILEDGTPANDTEDSPLTPMDLSGEWILSEKTDNALTLDRCDYYFDDVLQDTDSYVLNIQQQACDLQRPVKVTCVFKAALAVVPETIYLACEQPDDFAIFINGQQLQQVDCGYFVDKSFRKLKLSDCLQVGENTITLVTNFHQPEELYDNLKKAQVFESEKNKLTYASEIEAIYLVGDFCCSSPTNVEALSRNAFRCSGPFQLAESPRTITLHEIEKQGFLFFAGKLQVEKHFQLTDTNYQLVFSKTGINAIRVVVNGCYVDTIIWNPTTLAIASYLKAGDNCIQLTLVNNLRNLLGPHHLQQGESYEVKPSSFYQEPCVWNRGLEEAWHDDYCFVELSLY